MLKRITLENFFSFGEPTTIELNPGVNLLLGINGSGKSNFLKALELLRAIYNTGDIGDLVWKQWGGLGNVLNFTSGVSEIIRLVYEFEFSEGKGIKYELTIEVEENKRTKNYEIREALESYGVTDQEVFWGTTVKSTVDEFISLYFDDAGTILKEKEEVLGKRKPTELEFTEQSLRFFLAAVRKYEDVSEVWAEDVSFLLEGCLNPTNYNHFDLSSKGPIRQANEFGFEEYLLEDGSNLNTIVNNIKNNHSLSYDKLEERIRDINPQFKEIGFNVFGSRMYLTLRERNLAKAIPVDHISDGTLYYLLLLAICYNPDRGKLVCFDEPETGLHPDMIHTIAKAFKAASKTTQFFIATHSPLFVDDFELEELIIFEKDQKNQTKVRTIDDTAGIDTSYPTGQLWLNGELGGTRW